MEKENARVCPHCGSGGTKVTDSRTNNDGRLKRIRECMSCGCRYLTYEVIQRIINGGVEDGKNGK